MKSKAKGRAINTFFTRSKEPDNQNCQIDLITKSKECEEEQEPMEMVSVEAAEDVVPPENSEISSEEKDYTEQSKPENELEKLNDTPEETEKKAEIQEAQQSNETERVAEEDGEQQERSLAKQDALEPGEITSAMKEIDRLNQMVQDLTELLGSEKTEKDKNEKLYLELKDILVKIGLTKDLNILEDIKMELNKEKENNEFLENALKEKEVFIEKLKKGIFSGINQLFDQRPPNQIVGNGENQVTTNKIENQENKKDEKKPVRSVKSNDEITKAILNLNQEGKNLIEISEITNIPKQKIDEVLKKHLKNEEKGA